jgi:hypothetical protein
MRVGRKQFEAGEVFTEVIGAEHKGRNVGSRPVKLIVFYVGEVGSPSVCSNLSPNDA